MMIFVGIFLGFLGIGSGIFKVLVFDIIMKLFFKVLIVISNFMMGVIVLVSISIYFVRGDIVYDVCGVVVVGVFVGFVIGVWFMFYIKLKYFCIVFVLILIYIFIEMIRKGLF